MLKSLGFIHQSNPLDMFKWDDLWEDLCRLNKYKSEVTIQNLLLFMAAIQNFIGLADDRECDFKLSKSFAVQLHKKYLRLCQNRQDYLRERRIATKKTSVEVLPNLSTESPNMKKLKSSIKRIELILEKGKEYAKKKQELSQTKQDQLDPELTLQPMISYTKKTKDVSRNDIWRDLHQDSEKYHSKKVDKARDTIEYVKEPHEYTFQPDIERLRLKQMTSPSS